MDFSKAFNFFTRRRRDYLKFVELGYQSLKDSDSMSRIADINRELTVLLLEIPEKYFSNHIFGEGVHQAEIVCRQYLLTRIAGTKLNRELLYTLGKSGAFFAYTIPPVWREFFKTQGFSIHKVYTALLWNWFIGLMLLFGVFRIFKIVFSGVQAICKNSKKDLGQYTYFDSLSYGNLPQPCKDGRSHDIFSWYMRWADRAHEIDTLTHSVTDNEHRVVSGCQVVSIPSPILPFRDCRSVAMFFVWGVIAIGIALLDFVRGRWWHALILNQAALSAQARIQDPKELASDYLFHNSNWIYRPLWTYEVIKKNKRVLFYFYALCSVFKVLEENPPLPYGWQAMNWPHYLVWDEYQSEFIQRAVGKSKTIDIVGPICFNTTNSVEMPKIDRKAVAVFDLAPVNYAFYITLGREQEYYVPDICIAFLNDISQVANDSGYMMAWKQKRKRKDTDPVYNSFSEDLSIQNNVMSINPDISPNRVIENSNIVISMPFTSTAIIARELGKPSYYYDPTGLICQNDKAAHGIKIISGFDELKCLFENIETH